MLFSYTYVPHQMDRMQAFIDFVFHEVWCKASEHGDFNLDLFEGDPDLKELMESFYYGDTQGGDFFYSHVERIYALFADLDGAQTETFKCWYQANNDIENVCANLPECNIARYADIESEHMELCLQLAGFFKGLYSQSLLGLSIVKEKVGRIDDHYQSFMEENDLDKCPFCGIADILGIYHSKREAYDHYLPKSLYPFNSINFHNLVPACHHCNSSYKTTCDPAYSAKDPAGNNQRRKSFYPYSENRQSIQISIELSSSDIENLKPEDIQISYDSQGFQEEVATWLDVYDMDERYKAKCCSKSDGKYWLSQVLDEWQEGGRSPEDYLKTVERQSTKHPYADCNFLRKAFLKSCDAADIFQI